MGNAWKGICTQSIKDHPFVQLLTCSPLWMQEKASFNCKLSSRFVLLYIRKGMLQASEWHEDTNHFD